jgi:hypothetical protein
MYILIIHINTKTYQQHIEIIFLTFTHIKFPFQENIQPLFGQGDEGDEGLEFYVIRFIQRHLL